MTKRLIVTEMRLVDTKTGESAPARVTQVESRGRSPFPKTEGFVLMNPRFIFEMANDPELTLKTRVIIDHLIAGLDSDNVITTTPTRLATQLNMALPHVSRELRKLKDKNIVLEIEAEGLRPKYLRMNARIIWVGDWDRGRIQYSKDPELKLETKKPQRKPRLKLVVPGAELETDPRQVGLKLD
jgi:DNA-binding transcriptional ArsR family regulator